LLGLAAARNGLTDGGRVRTRLAFGGGISQYIADRSTQSQQQRPGIAAEQDRLAILEGYNAAKKWITKRRRSSKAAKLVRIDIYDSNDKLIASVDMEEKALIRRWKEALKPDQDRKP
jgi:hypothetical protein